MSSTTPSPTPQYKYASNDDAPTSDASLAVGLLFAGLCILCVIFLFWQHRRDRLRKVKSTLDCFFDVPTEDTSSRKRVKNKNKKKETDVEDLYDLDKDEFLDAPYSTQPQSAELVALKMDDESDDEIHMATRNPPSYRAENPPPSYKAYMARTNPHNSNSNPVVSSAVRQTSLQADMNGEMAAMGSNVDPETLAELRAMGITGLPAE